jgi:hypothetical protein
LSGNGVLYIATGKKYIEAAIASAKTVRKTCPDLPIAFFGDWQNYGFKFASDPFPFHIVEEIAEPHRRSKVDYLSRTPFEFTLYLDTDTIVREDIREIFGVLDRFDIGVTHAMRRNAAERLLDWRIPVPKAFPQFNSGVILYRSTPGVLAFMEEWSSHFHEAGFAQDQMTYRELLWLSNLRITVLPPEYNVRYEKYHYLWSETEATTKIFHLQRLHTGSLWMSVKPFYRRLVKGLARFGIKLPDRLVQK